MYYVFKDFKEKLISKLVITLNIYLLLMNFYYSYKIRFYDTK